MAATLSQMVTLGTTAPEFRLPDTVSGREVSLEELRGNVATVVLFICNHCPAVRHINSVLVAIANEFIPKGIGFVAISSNDATTYTDDSPEKMKETALALGYPFPYLYDESQDVAKSYSAVCTPDIFIYDAGLKLVYRGQFDNSRPSNTLPVTGADMRAALDALCAGLPVSEEQKPSIGCNIKWKKPIWNSVL